MTLKLRILLIVIVVISCVYAVRQIRRRRLSLAYSLLWLVMALLMLLAAIFPQLIYDLSDAIGLGLPINMVLLAFSFFSLVMLFYLTMIVSQLNDRNRRLTQQMALLEERVRKLEKNDPQPEEGKEGQP